MNISLYVGKEKTSQQSKIKTLQCKTKEQNKISEKHKNTKLIRARIISKYNIYYTTKYNK